MEENNKTKKGQKGKPMLNPEPKNVKKVEKVNKTNKVENNPPKAKANDNAKGAEVNKKGKVENNAKKAHESKELLVEKKSKMSHSTPFSMRLLGSFIKDISFENPVGPYNLTAAPKVDTQCSLNVTRINETIFEVTIMMKCVTIDSNFSENIDWGNGLISNLELSYAGIFEVTCEDKDVLHRLLFVDCAALISPIMRSCIINMTSYSGLPPITIDNISYLTWDNEYSPKEQKIK